MRIDVKTRGIRITNGLRQLVRRSIHFALGRFSSRVQRVTVTIADVNGPRGGVDKHCTVKIAGRPSWDVLVRDQDADPNAAVARAIARAGRATARRVDRLRDGRPNRWARAM